MSIQTLNWNIWRTFLAVLETGSLSAAARRLSLTQPTAGRHVDQLEEAMSAPLFTRSQDGLAPTELARRLVPQAEAMAAAANSLARIATSTPDALAGTVRVSASEIVGVEILPMAIAELKQQHPSIEVELVISNEQHDLLHRDADIAIRMTRPKQQRLIAKKLGSVRVGLFGHKSYLESRSIPQNLADITQLDLIGPDREMARWSGYSLDVSDISALPIRFRCDSDLAQLAALRAGVGIGACQCAIARRNGELVRLLSDEIDVEIEIWLAMHEDLKLHPVTKTTFDVLSSVLPSHAF